MEHLFRHRKTGSPESKTQITNTNQEISHGVFTRAEQVNVTVHGPNEQTRDITLVKRNPHNEQPLSPVEQSFWLETYEYLRELGVPTYSTMRTDQSHIYTTMLNTAEQVAVSVNNKIPAQAEQFQEHTTIANIEELVRSVFTSTQTMIEGGIDMSDYDAFFYIISTAPEPESLAHHVDHLVGDYDCLTIGHNHVAIKPMTSLEKARVSLELFFERFGTPEQEELFDTVVEQVYKEYVPE